jgi:hypothetical protein
MGFSITIMIAMRKFPRSGEIVSINVGSKNFIPGQLIIFISV